MLSLFSIHSQYIHILVKILKCQCQFILSIDLPDFLLYFMYNVQTLSVFLSKVFIKLNCKRVSTNYFRQFKMFKIKNKRLAREIINMTTDIK